MSNHESHHESRHPSAKELIGAIQSTRDRARVQAHLLSLDTKKRWDEIETGLLGVQSKLERGGQEVAASAVAKVHDLTQSAKALLREIDGKLELARPVGAVMRKELNTCSPEDSLVRAAQLMWDGDCGALPVLDSAGKVVGVITDRDLCMAAYTRGTTLAAISVSSTMHPEVYACTPEDSIGDAMRLMASRQVRRLPVIDDGKLVGVITMADIVRHVSEYQGNSVAACIAVTDTLAEISEKRAPQSVHAAAE